MSKSPNRARPLGSRGHSRRTVLLVVATWLSSIAGAEAPSVPASDASRGAELFLAQGCSACHAFAPVGAGGLFAPPLDGVATTATARIEAPDYRGAASDAPAYLRESIVTPLAYVVPGYAGSYHRMPAYLHLSDEELDALIALLIGPAPEGREPAR